MDTAKGVAALALSLAVAGAALTLISWRADADAQRGAAAAALRWRPDVPLYRRQWAESMMVGEPERAATELRAVLRRDPFDNLAAADLTLVELAMDAGGSADTTAQGEARREPGFESSWLLANLAYAQGDTQAFWREAARSAQSADDAAFASIAYQALAVSGGDFERLRSILPGGSRAAATAYLNAAVSRQNEAAAQEGFRWLAGFPPPPGGDAQVAARQYLEHAWSAWPQDVADIWARGRAAAIFHGPAKNDRDALLMDGNFDPDFAESTGLMGWQGETNGGVIVQPLLTHEPAFPTAAALQFDGSESGDADLRLEWQWIVAPAKARLEVSVYSRALTDAPAAGVRLQLVDALGHPLGTLPIGAGPSWSVSRGTIATTAATTASYRLELRYQRPLAQLPIRNTVLLSDVSVLVLP